MGSTISMALLFVFAVLLLNAHLGSCGCFKRIFAFGDSIIDTGNFRSGSMWGAPYGGTYFHHPTGRCSDGHLIVDFYAQALGLPLLPPSGPEEKTGQFPTGANFAVLGSVALSPDYYSKRGNRQEAHIAGRIDRVRGRCMGPTLEAGLPLHIVDARMGHVCLDWQLGSFKTVLSRIAPGKAATKSLLSESLIVFGEIGGNDYNFWFYDRERSRDTPYQYMPDVINRIGSGVQEVINLGAKTILVPGNFPIGCVPVYLSGHKTNKSTDYDQFGCLKWYNKFSQKHNQLLKQEVGRLRSRNPGVKIIYADYYSAAMEFVRNPKRNGIDDPLLACCGGNGPYGTGHECDQNAKVCRDPSRFANWDQVHMTEKAYSVIANGVLNGPYADIPLLHAC